MYPGAQKNILDNLPFSMGIVTLDGVTVYVNPAFLKLFATDESIVGTRNTFGVWDSAESREEWLRSAHGGGHGTERELLMRTADNRRFWALVGCSPIECEGRDCLMVTHRDITERRRVEAALRDSEEKYRQLFRNAVEAIVVLQDGRLRLSNPTAENLFGHTAENLTGMSFLTLIHPGDRSRIEGHRTLKSGGARDNMRIRFRVIRRDGQVRWVEMDCLAISWDGQDAELLFLMDITDSRKAENRLLQSEEKYRIVAEHASDVIWVYNYSRDRFSYVSPAVHALRGITADAAMQECLEDALLHDFVEIAREEIERRIPGFIEKPDAPASFMLEAQQPCVDGNAVWVEMSLKFRYNDQGEVELVGVSRNIEERKRQERQVVYLSYYDQLTGLYNRRFYEEELRRLDTSRNLPISLIMADVNGLKLTNDAFGHLVGDKLLIRVAELIRRESRHEDIVSRTGGDEFVLLLPRTDAREAEAIVSRLRRHLELEKPDEVVLSVSFGWATKTHEKQDMESIFTQAEDVMYRRKLMDSKSMKSRTIRIITQSLYEKDRSEERHAGDVSALCAELARRMQLNGNEAQDLGLAGLLHDIGKITLDGMLLLKPAALDALEWTEMKRHPEIGYQILRSVSEFARVAETVLCHHENLDGTGYPRGLSDGEISLSARILRVAEAWCTMTSDQPYRKALEAGFALNELECRAGSWFDPEVVCALSGWLEESMVPDGNRMGREPDRIGPASASFN